MALFANSADFATMAPLLETADWNKVLPSIDLVERQYLRNQVLGHTLYTTLHTAYQGSLAVGGPALSSDMLALLSACRPVVAALGTHKAMSKLSVMFTASGPMVSKTDTMAPPAMWQSRQAQATILEEGLGYLDQLIDFLLGSGSTYQWQTSPFAVTVRKCIVRTVEHIQEHHVNIGNSAWTLHMMRPAMLIQQDRLRGVLSDDAFGDLMLHIDDTPITGANAEILGPARAAVIHLALAELAVTNSITINPDGAWMWQAASSAGTSGGPGAATNHRLDQVARSYRQAGEEQLKAVESIAKRLAAAGQYPLYAASPQNAQPFVRGSTTADGSSSFSTF